MVIRDEKKQKGLLLMKREVKNNKCKICGSKDIASLFTKKDYIVYQCNICNIRFINLPHSYKKFVKHYYDKSYFTGNILRNAYIDYEGDKRMILRNFKNKIDKIKKIVPHGNLLDIGCATGLFLDLAVKNEFSVFGIEPSTYAYEIARKRISNNSIKLGTIETAKFKSNFFEVITLFDVFEHLADPINNLKKLYKWLKPGGYLVIVTGDSESKFAKFFGKYWHFYNLPQHIFFYSNKTITKVLIKQGFKPTNVEYCGKSFSLRYLLHLASTIYSNRPAHHLLNFLTKTPLGQIPVYLNFRDTMTIYAQK